MHSSIPPTIFLGTLGWMLLVLAIDSLDMSVTFSAAAIAIASKLFDQFDM